jgi:hypothetical protein
MSLDERLGNLEFTSITGTKIAMELTDVEIAVIKQAFADEGYLKFPQDIQESRLMDASEVRLSGKQWYDRFEKEAESLSHYIRSLFREGYPTATHEDEREMFVKLDVLEAAKRASGLEDSSNSKDSDGNN